MKEKVQLEVTAAPGTLSLYNLVLHVVLPVLIVFSVLPVLVSLAATLQNNVELSKMSYVLCALQDPDREGMGRDLNLVFTVSWFDPTMEKNRKFTLTFYPGDNSVEMVS